MGRPPVGKELPGLRIGTNGQILDLIDAALPQAMDDIGRQVELPMIGPLSRREKPSVLRISRSEAGLEFRPDLICALPDAGADRRTDAFTGRAKPKHGADDRIGDAGDRT